MADIGRQKGESDLVLALASGASMRDAAKKAGIAERTAYRRFRDPVFRGRVSDARARMFDRALGQLSFAASEAVTALRGLLTGESESVRVRAARTLLELGNRLRESVELEQRIARLEESINGEKLDRTVGPLRTNGRGRESQRN